ncbi:TonB-linked SusC/RagA family outer membrane protein [Lewinella antarctica]|uniref:TonB-linked SusC/RagA family outer membrane protein n=1 Tax=Neolewinella antarctica TaxID=442734 RepID=A0ABX0X6T2_9BACT|nr:TonB-linked SusC/RagA family outer membrane protein [Neolewinella antarctica]
MVQQNSGDPAGGISIRLRGATTITGSSDPLYIIDGIIVNNSSNNLVDLGGNSQNRLVDINPADIDRIEVIKGAAAAAIYGSRASNGVVQIFTKRGKQGAPRINFTTNFRVNQLRNQIDYNTVPLAWEDRADLTNLNTVPVERFNYQDDIFATGYGTDNNVSISGGSDKTRYFISGGYLSNEGAVKNTSFQRFTGRLNLDQEINNWLSLSFGLNYARSSSNDIPNGGIASSYGAITGFLFANNENDPRPNADGVYPGVSIIPRTNPLEAVNRLDFGSTTNRTITNLSLTAVPTENLTIKYLLGVDFTNSSATGFIPIGNTSPEPGGFSRRADVNGLQYNNDLNASYNFNVAERIASTTVVGGTWQYEDNQQIAIQSSRIAPFINISSLGELTEPGERRFEISYWGAFVQQTFGFNNKLFLTGALRLDGSSVFGPDERGQLYGKVSGSYVLSEENFWEAGLGSFVNTFKLRASWGQAGNLTAIGPFERLSNFRVTNYLGTTPAFPAASLGNTSLAPERQEEVEVGFDAGFLNNRVGLEFTYYRQRVTDLLLRRELAPSTGYGLRTENVGELENSGIELALNATPVKTADFVWDVTATYANNTNEITSVAGGGQITFNGSFSTSAVIEGEPIGVFYRQFYARDEAGNLLLNDAGFPFSGRTEEGLTSKVLGDPNPDWFGSFINEFKYKNFGMRVQFDAVQGFDIFNWNRRLLDNPLFGGGAGVGEELLGNRQKGYGGAVANIFEEFVEDGSFVKLREFSLNYSFRPRTDAIESVRISLVGRNLISWDSYSGWDPEINTAGQSNGVRGFDFAGVPIPRTYQVGLNLSF